MFLKDNALNQYKTVSSGVLMYVKFIYQWQNVLRKIASCRRILPIASLREYIISQISVNSHSMYKSEAAKSCSEK